MSNSIQIFAYQDRQVEFDLSENNVMVNASEMGKIFGKLPKDFLKTEPTKNFINECLKKDYTPFLFANSVFCKDQSFLS